MSIENNRVLSQRTVEHQVVIPKLIRTEEITERVETQTETRLVEDITEEIVKVRETQKHIARPVIHEKLVEVEEIEYREVPQSPSIRERIVERPVVQVQTKLVEIPRKIEQHKVIEQAEFEFVPVVTEKEVKIPEVKEEVVIVEKRVPHVVKVQVPEPTDVIVEREVHRRIPLPLEHVTKLKMELPALEPEYEVVDVPVYVPRFIEVPVPVESMDDQLVHEMKRYSECLTGLTLTSASTLFHVENLASEIRRLDMENAFVPNKLAKSWTEGTMPIEFRCSVVP